MVYHFMKHINNCGSYIQTPLSGGQQVGATNSGNIINKEINEHINIERRLPGPSKGCKMYPKWCQFTIPEDLIGTPQKVLVCMGMGVSHE